jgi:O-antigen/teichoic acid export membrane protein
VTSRLIGFTAFALLARRLDPNEYGAVEFAVALALFFAMVVDFGLETIGARSISRNRNEVARLAAQIPAARLLMALIAVPVMGAVAMVSGQPETTVHLVWLFSIGLFAVPWFQRWLFQGLEMMDWVSLGQVIRSAVFCLGVVIFVRGPADVLAVGQIEIMAAVAATVVLPLRSAAARRPGRTGFLAPRHSRPPPRKRFGRLKPDRVGIESIHVDISGGRPCKRR